MNNNTIFGTSFATVKNFAKFVLKTTNAGEEIKFEFSRSILKKIYDNHPFKPPISGEYKIVVVRKKPFNTKCFAIISPEQALYTFSVKNALKKKALNLRQEINILLRKAISKDIIKRKEDLINNFGLFCQKSGRPYEWSELTLHHESPYEFNVICDLFLIEQKLNLSSDLLKINSEGKFVFKDEIINSKFKYFHRKFLTTHTSLVSRKYNETQGSRFKFSNDNIFTINNFLKNNSAQPVQLSLFDGGSNVF